MFIPCQKSGSATKKSWNRTFGRRLFRRAFVSPTRRTRRPEFSKICQFYLDSNASLHAEIKKYRNNSIQWTKVCQLWVKCSPGKATRKIFRAREKLTISQNKTNPDLEFLVHLFSN